MQVTIYAEFAPHELREFQIIAPERDPVFKLTQAARQHGLVPLEGTLQFRECEVPERLERREVWTMLAVDREAWNREVGR